MPLNQVQATSFYLKCQEYCSCHQIVRLYVCWQLFLLHFGVPVVPLFSSYS